METYFESGSYIIDFEKVILVERFSNGIQVTLTNNGCEKEIMIRNYEESIGFIKGYLEFLESRKGFQKNEQ